MKLIKTKSFLTILLAAMFSMATSHSVLADDTDIYINNTAPPTSEPMVMFALDLRSNLTSTICNKFTYGDSDATIATACNWDPNFVTYLTDNDKKDGVIDLFELLRAALAQAMDGLDGVKIGLMVPHGDTCTGATKGGPTKNDCSNGGYIVYGFHSIDATDSNGNKKLFFNKLAGIPSPQGTTAEPYQAKEMYFEFFRYLTGQGIYNAHVGYEDYGNTDATDNLNGTDKTGAVNLESPDYSGVAWDTGIEALGNTTYTTPLTSLMTCAKIYVVNVAFGVTNTDDDSDSAISDTKANGGMNSLNLTGASNQFDTVINWMYKNDLADGTYGTAPNIDGVQNVTSYFLTDKVNTTTNGWASAGGTGNAIALGSDPTALTNKLKNIFSQILSVSTTFVSASVPVNVFNRADYLDDVYMALFQADKNGYPFWDGNLKKLKLMQDSSNAWYIGDVNKNPAFGKDGRINFDALTFWTDPTGTDVQTADTTIGEIVGDDGRSVSRGGAGQQIPNYLAGNVGLLNSDGYRKIYTEPDTYTNGTTATLMDLDATGGTGGNADKLWPYLNANGTYASGTLYLNNTAWSGAADYASASAAEKTEALDLLKWARGYDPVSGKVRNWLMGDPVHSRPLAINYGIIGAGNTDTNPDVRIVIGGNDGFVHMIQNVNNADGSESGKENWAFIPRYALRILKRLKDDNGTLPIHPYGVDGVPVIYTHDEDKDGNIKSTTTGDKAYVIFGMRRGGRGYYALDVTNPDSPKMLWSINNTMSDFAELGLTFSTPQLAYINYKDSSGVTLYNQPVLVFAGGYDTNKDTRSNSVGTNDSMGRAIYVVDVNTGSLIWKAVYGASTGNVSATEYHNSYLTDSIPSDVTLLDSDGNGSIDRIYVGDTGGQIFRADLADLDRTNWFLRRFANVGRHDANNKKNDRRFFHAPDVVQTRYNGVNYDAVIIGSGDRANPLDKGVGTNIPDNWFYMFKDTLTTSGDTTAWTAYSHSSLADVTTDCIQTLTCTGSGPDLSNGWKFDLTQTPGEKALSHPITVNGIIFFTTFLPPDYSTASGTCKPLEGDGSIYAVNLQDGGAAFNWDLTNTTTSPTGDALELGATDRYMHAGSGIPADVIVIRKDGKLQAILPGQNYTKDVNTNSGYKTFWYVDGE